MITAVDTSVLIDVLADDPQFGDRSAAAIRGAIARGRLVACDAVWAEVAVGFQSAERCAEVMAKLRVDFSAMNDASALLAGQTYRTWRQAGGRRKRVVADFVIGAHAQLQADRLLTRDRGYYRRYFGELTVVDPCRD